MLRPSSGAFARSSLQIPRNASVRHSALRTRFAPSSRRWASSSAPKIKYGFRGSLVRWGIAAGGIYWYTTQGSKVLAEEPSYIVPSFPQTEHEDENLPTVEDLHSARKARQAQKTSSDAQTSSTVATGAEGAGGLADGVGELEEEADSEGAFNPETGEINWDCPCLGGMAHGPCGPEFKEAFSCFIFSKEEQKGSDCIDKFRGMQDCFRKHPDIYGEELKDDDEDESEVDGKEGAKPVPTAGVAASEVAAQTADSSAPASAASHESSPAPAHMSAIDAPVPAAPKK